MLNLNIYYDKDYWLQHSKLFNQNIYQSSIFNKYYSYLYKKNKPLNNKFIKSGPQKLVNNFLIYFNERDDVSFNKEVFENYYFLTFTNKDLFFLEEILKKNKKVIVGPLYTNNDFLRLVELVNMYQNLNIISASIFAKNTMIEFSKNMIDESRVKILPVGVASENQIKNNSVSNTERKKCLIYFKGRNNSELNFVLGKLSKNNIGYKLFKYGNYDNADLLKYSKQSAFGIIIGRTESQGIAINEMMSSNLPLFVLNSKENNYEGIVYDGSTVPFWNNECGIKIDNIDDFENKFQDFLFQLDNNIFKPYKYAIKELSFEAMEDKMKNIFNSF